MSIYRICSALAATILLATAAVAPATAEPDLTLAEAVSRTLHGNSRVAAAAYGVQAGQEAALQAGRRPNPELGIEWENLAGTGELAGIDASEVTLLASQLLETSGKRGLRQDHARLQGGVGEWDRRTLVADLVRRTHVAFLEVWIAQEEVQLAIEQMRVDEHLAQEVSSRHEAGAASPIDVSRARVVVASGRIAARHAEQELDSARRRLASLWGAGPDFERVAADFETVSEPDDASAPAGWEERNPDLARWRTELALHRAEASLHRALGRPDLTVGLGVRRENAGGDVALVLEAGLPLPLFDRNRPAVRAAEYRVERAGQLAAATRAEAEAELEIALGERAAAYEEIAILREDVLPRAAEAYEDGQAGHRRGLFSLTDVLEIRRSLFELRRTLLAAIVSYHRAEIRIGRLTGTLVGMTQESGGEETR